MRAILKYWPVIVGVVAALSFGLQTSAAIQKHLDEDARRDERIRVLEQIEVSEHPQYSATIYWAPR